MRIGMIGQKGIPSRAGGVEIHVEELGAHLAEAGHDVTAYVRESYLDTNPSTDKNGTAKKHTTKAQHRGIHLVYVKNINTKHFDAVTSSFLATVKAIKDRPDIIHYHAIGPSMFAWLPRLFGIKVVSTVHGLDWKREKWGKLAKMMLKFGEWVGIHCAHQTIVVGKSLIPYYLDKHKKKPVYIPNGVFIPSKKPMSILESEYGLKSKAYILFLSRLVPEKGAHYLLDAFKQVKTDMQLVIAGGTSHSDDYVDSLKEKAAKDKRVLMTGFVTGDTLEALYSNAYAYVLPSTIEGLPISLLEAMSYGVTSLTSDIAENKSVIEGHGYMFVNKDVEDLKQQLQYLIEENALLDEASIIDYVRENYSWDQVTQRTEKVYRQVCRQ